MGWSWKDDSGFTFSSAGETDEFHGMSIPKGSGNSNGTGNRCATRKVVTSKCRTVEVEPGKFIRKCDKTEQIFRDFVGRPSEVVESIKEYTEEDVTDNMVSGPFPLEPADRSSPFHFPGLHSDIEDIERDFVGGINRFFEAAEEMKNDFFSSVKIPHTYDDQASASHKKHGIHIESSHPSKAPPKKNTDGEFDLSGLAKDV